MNISVGLRLSENQLRGQQTISNLIMFTVLDALLDHWYPGMEGESFKVRYKGLPKLTPRERVIAGVYRIMRLIRNALVHDRRAVKMKEGKTTIELQHSKGISKLVYRSAAIVYLNTIILLLLRTRNFDDNYVRGMLTGYYEWLCREVIELADDMPEPLPSHDYLYPFRPFVRYRLEETVIPLQGVQSCQVKRHRLADIESGWASDEVLVHHLGRMYLVPGECIDDEGIIPFSILENWEIPANHPCLNW